MLQVGKGPEISIFNKFPQDLPTGRVVKTSPSHAGGAGLISGRGATIPHEKDLTEKDRLQYQFHWD